MMGDHQGPLLRERAEGIDDLQADLGMETHRLVLGLRVRPALVEDRVLDPDLAHIVKLPDAVYGLDSLLGGMDILREAPRKECHIHAVTDGVAVTGLQRDHQSVLAAAHQLAQVAPLQLQQPAFGGLQR